MINRFAIAALASLAFAVPATAAIVTFNTTPGGSQAEGFVATGEPGISWTSALGSGLSVNTLSESNNSPALLAFDDTNGNFIIGTLATAAISISLDFGNDDPGFTLPGDLALLTVYNGITMVGFTAITLTPDDLMNQTISFSGPSFTSFSFAYTNAAGLPFTGGGAVSTGLIEVIDNVTVTAVPEPATWGLMIAGFGIVGFAARRRRAVVVA